MRTWVGKQSIVAISKNWRFIKFWGFWSHSRWEIWKCLLGCSKSFFLLFNIGLVDIGNSLIDCSSVILLYFYLVNFVDNIIIIILSLAVLVYGCFIYLLIRLPLVFHCGITWFLEIIVYQINIMISFFKYFINTFFILNSC